MNTLPSSSEPTHDPHATGYCKTVAGQWVKVVRGMIHGLSHGEVQLTIKDGEVVEVRKLEKIRFEHPHHPPRRRQL